MKTAVLIILLILLEGCATPERFYYEQTFCVNVGIGDPETIKEMTGKFGAYRPGENKVLVSVDKHDLDRTRLIWGDEFLHVAGILDGEHRIKINE